MVFIIMFVGVFLWLFCGFVFKSRLVKMVMLEKMVIDFLLGLNYERIYWRWFEGGWVVLVIGMFKL